MIVFAAAGLIVNLKKHSRSTGGRAYLDANRISMQKPIGGRSVLAFFSAINNLALYRGEGGHARETALLRYIVKAPLNKGAIAF